MHVIVGCRSLLLWALLSFSLHTPRGLLRNKASDPPQGVSTKPNRYLFLLCYAPPYLTSDPATAATASTRSSSSSLHLNSDHLSGASHSGLLLPLESWEPLELGSFRATIPPSHPFQSPPQKTARPRPFQLPLWCQMALAFIVLASSARQTW